MPSSNRRSLRFSLRAVACAAAVLFGASAVSAGAAPRLLSYYPYYAKWQTPSYTAAQIPYGEMTHILHAFIEPAPTGKLKIPKGFLEPALIANARAAGVRVSVSIGGAGAAHAKAFATLSASPSARNAFVANVVAFVGKYGYDGVDIDWEVPAPKDAKNCVALMQALRAALPAPAYQISMAAPANPLKTGFDVVHLAGALDYFNVMTYDFTGPWSIFAGLNSPLYQSPNDPWQTGSLKTAMDLYSGSFGVAPAQLNIGTAFYGYQFDGVDALWGSCGGSCKNVVQTHDYGNYIKPLIGQNGWTAFVDSYTGAPYLTHEGPKAFVTYDDATSTASKVDYVIGQRGFGGMFMWDLSADYDGQGQDLLTAMWSEFQVVGNRLR